MEQDNIKIIRPHEGFQEKFVRSNVDVCFGGGQLGGGKAQPLDCQVCTPFGFRRMGDLKVGDIITNSQGGMQKVIHIYERGIMDTIEFEFADGRKTRCALDHLWKVKKVARIPKRVKIHNDKDLSWEIMTTEQIISLMDKNKKVNIPICSPIQFTRGNRTQGLTIHPYLLGSLLGDGCIAGYLSSPKLFTADKEISEKISMLGYDITKNKSSEITYTIHDRDVVKHLKQKKLFGCLSDAKFIPDVYKYSTIEDRIELLQGLFDTDGSAKGATHIEYDTVSEKLAKDIQWIVRSLGGYCTITEKQGFYRNENGEKVICKKVYRLYISINIANKLFYLKRKADKLNGLYRNGFCTELRIVSYKRLEPTEMRCISVSNPDNLYITDDFIVTHNSFGAILACAEPSLDPEFKACFLRTNIDDFKAGGGLIDSIRLAYGDSVNITTSKKPRATFESGAFIECMHVANQSLSALEDDFKGTQYDLIYYDELTNFEWGTFCFLFSRNRGQAKWTNKIRATTNPKRRHWVRTFIDWYIGLDGRIIPEREGVVRYFFNAGKTVKDVVWGNSKEEVYAKCKRQIDDFLKDYNGKEKKAQSEDKDKPKRKDATYEDVILSFTFYKGDTRGNSAIGTKYAGSVAAMGSSLAAENVGNWNTDIEDDDNICISSSEANQVFMNDPMRNGDKWITCDLADVGTDNFVAIAWNGFHIEDILIVNKSEPRDNAEYMMSFAKEHGIPDNRIIYDGVRARYINDYIPDSEPFISNSQTRGIYGRMFRYLKDECFGRLVEVIKRGNLSIEENIANRIYKHQRLKVQSTIQNEFIEECLVVSFKEGFGGKKALLSKKEMNSKLGKERSMDLLDAIAMRMLPVLDYAYGEELIKSMPEVGYDDDEDDDYFGRESIYETSSWY